MKFVFASILVAGLAVPHQFAAAAGLDAGAYVSQASGFTSKAMSMADLLAPVKTLAANLPHLPATQGNASFVFQNGDYNNAAILQAGVHNASMVAQTGYQNSAFIQQYGSGHQSFVIQNGMGNIASVTQR